MRSERDEPSTPSTERSDEPPCASLGAAPAFTETSGLPGARRGHRQHGSARGPGFIPEWGQGYDRDVSEMSSGPPSIRIPRWIQLVGLPVLLLVVFLLARTLGHVLFLFLTASVIAFTLNPLVRDLTRLKLPRGLSVAVVSVIFATAFIGLLVALGTVVVSETRSAAERIDTYLTEESSLTGQTGVEVDVDRLQAWLDDHGLEGIRIEEQLDDLTESIGAGDVSGYVQDAISFAQGAALSVILFSSRSSSSSSSRSTCSSTCRGSSGRSTAGSRPARRAAADAADRAGALGLREGPGDPLGRDRHERRRRDVDPRYDRPRRGRREVRAPVRALDGLHRGDPVHRPVALGGAAGDLRARRRPGRRALGRCALRLHLPGGGSRRRAERDGERPAAPPAARHLRAARGRRALRHPRRAGGAARRWPPAVRSGSSSASASSSSRGTRCPEGAMPVEVELEPPRAEEPPRAASGAP